MRGLAAIAAVVIGAGSAAALDGPERGARWSASAARNAIPSVSPNPDQQSGPVQLSIWDVVGSPGESPTLTSGDLSTRPKLQPRRVPISLRGGPPPSRESEGEQVHIVPVPMAGLVGALGLTVAAIARRRMFSKAEC